MAAKYQPLWSHRNDGDDGSDGIVQSALRPMDRAGAQSPWRTHQGPSRYLLPPLRHRNLTGLVSGRFDPFLPMATVLSLNNGLHLTGVPFILDATRPEKFAFASHAHADHCHRHQKVLCTPATAELIQLRYGKTDFFTLPAGESAEVGGVGVTLFNAGHVLGSAQILLNVNGKRILYTGDLKPAGGVTTPPAAVPPCDILIIETTYGRPEYIFPPVAETIEALTAMIKRIFVRGLTPVLLAYGLGKAQEVMASLENEGFIFACHRTIYDVVKVYRKNGFPLSGAELFSGNRLREKVVILPPGMPRSREWKFIKNAYTIFLSGWAMNTGRRQSAVDATLPLSDHADYRQLVAFVKKTGAGTIYTHHGFPDLAQQLNRQGLLARHLEKKDSIDLLTGIDARPGGPYDLFDHRPQ